MEPSVEGGDPRRDDSGALDQGGGRSETRAGGVAEAEAAGHSAGRGPTGGAFPQR